MAANKETVMEMLSVYAVQNVAVRDTLLSYSNACVVMMFGNSVSCTQTAHQLSLMCSHFHTMCESLLHPVSMLL